MTDTTVQLPGHSARTHMLAGAKTSTELGPPRPGFPASAAEAFECAQWWTRFALDRLEDDGSVKAKALRTHGTAARTQHDAIAKALQLADS